MSSCEYASKENVPCINYSSEIYHPPFYRPWDEFTSSDYSLSEDFQHFHGRPERLDLPIDESSELYNGISGRFSLPIDERSKFCTPSFEYFSNGPVWYVHQNSMASVPLCYKSVSSFDHSSQEFFPPFGFYSKESVPPTDQIGRIPVSPAEHCSRKSLAPSDEGSESCVPPFACGLCGRYFSHAPQFKEHIQFHARWQPVRHVVCWPLFCDISDPPQADIPPRPFPAPVSHDSGTNVTLTYHPVTSQPLSLQDIMPFRQEATSPKNVSSLKETASKAFALSQYSFQQSDFERTSSKGWSSLPSNEAQMAEAHFKHVTIIPEEATATADISSTGSVIPEGMYVTTEGGVGIRDTNRSSETESTDRNAGILITQKTLTNALSVSSKTTQSTSGQKSPLEIIPSVAKKRKLSTTDADSLHMYSTPQLTSPVETSVSSHSLCLASHSKKAILLAKWDSGAKGKDCTESSFTTKDTYRLTADKDTRLKSDAAQANIAKVEEETIVSAAAEQDMLHMPCLVDGHCLVNALCSITPDRTACQSKASDKCINSKRPTATEAPRGIAASSEQGEKTRTAETQADLVRTSSRPSHVVASSVPAILPSNDNQTSGPVPSNITVGTTIGTSLSALPSDSRKQLFCTSSQIASYKSAETSNIRHAMKSTSVGASIFSTVSVTGASANSVKRTYVSTVPIAKEAISSRALIPLCTSISPKQSCSETAVSRQSIIIGARQTQQNDKSLSRADNMCGENTSTREFATQETHKQTSLSQTGQTNNATQGIHVGKIANTDMTDSCQQTPSTLRDCVNESCESPCGNVGFLCNEDSDSDCPCHVVDCEGSSDSDSDILTDAACHEASDIRGAVSNTEGDESGLTSLQREGTRLSQSEKRISSNADTGHHPNKELAPTKCAEQNVTRKGAEVQSLKTVLNESAQAKRKEGAENKICQISKMDGYLQKHNQKSGQPHQALKTDSSQQNRFPFSNLTPETVQKRMSEYPDNLVQCVPSANKKRTISRHSSSHTKGGKDRCDEKLYRHQGLAYETIKCKDRRKEKELKHVQCSHRKQTKRRADRQSTNTGKYRDDKNRAQRHHHYFRPENPEVRSNPVHATSKGLAVQDPRNDTIVTDKRQKVISRRKIVNECSNRQGTVQKSGYHKGTAENPTLHKTAMTTENHETFTLAMGITSVENKQVSMKRLPPNEVDRGVKSKHISRQGMSSTKSVGKSDHYTAKDTSHTTSKRESQSLCRLEKREVKPGSENQKHNQKKQSRVSAEVLTFTKCTSNTKEQLIPTAKERIFKHCAKTKMQDSEERRIYISNDVSTKNHTENSRMHSKENTTRNHSETRCNITKKYVTPNETTSSHNRCRNNDRSCAGQRRDKLRREKHADRQTENGASDDVHITPDVQSMEQTIDRGLETYQDGDQVCNMEYEGVQNNTNNGHVPRDDHVKTAHGEYYGDLQPDHHSPKRPHSDGKITKRHKLSRDQTDGFSKRHKRSIHSKQVTTVTRSYQDEVVVVPIENNSFDRGDDGSDSPDHLADTWGGTSNCTDTHHRAVEGGTSVAKTGRSKKSNSYSTDTHQRAVESGTFVENTSHSKKSNSSKRRPVRRSSSARVRRESGRGVTSQQGVPADKNTETDITTDAGTAQAGCTGSAAKSGTTLATASITYEGIEKTVNAGPKPQVFTPSKASSVERRNIPSVRLSEDCHNTSTCVSHNVQNLSPNFSETTTNGHMREVMVDVCKAGKLDVSSDEIVGSAARPIDLTVFDPTGPGLLNRYKCPLCDATFIKYSKYTFHLNNHDQRRFYCELCGKSFGRKESLKVHRMLHTGESAVDCHVCGKTLSSTASLVTHMRIHTDERPYSCPICPRAFRQPSALTSHYRTHTGEKPFQCNVCLKAYRFRKNLDNHRYVHSGECPYMCTICKASYYQVGALNIHLKVHRGERPFACPFCRMRFGQKSHLSKHRTRVHPETLPESERWKAKVREKPNKPYHCEGCGQGFTTLFSKRRHSTSFCPVTIALLQVKNIKIVPTSNTLESLTVGP